MRSYYLSYSFFIALGSIFLLAHSQTTPNANEQCRIIYNSADASFCQNSSSTICTALACRARATDTTCNTTFAAAEGTACRIGYTCQGGKCLPGQSSQPYDCLFGDNLLVNQTTITDPLPSSPMSCSDFMVYIIANSKNPFVYCENAAFRSVCCQTCKTYDKFTCRDVSAAQCDSSKTLCNNTSILLGGLPLNVSCPWTCGNCPVRSLQLTCDNCPCQNGATCVPAAATNNLLFGFYCQCPPGYLGQYCELKYPCNPNPCLNGGTCSVSGPLGYKCACAAGYGGLNCGNLSLDLTNIVNPCYPNPCANGGLCNLNGFGGFTCNCPPIYSGISCDIVVNPCSVNSPCQNGGFCNPNYNQWPYYSCNCPNGFSGSNCLLPTTTQVYDPCSSNPCVNGGICLRTGTTTYTCQCPPLYTGVCCDIYLNPCQPNPCYNDASCSSNTNNWPYYSCSCPPGCFGQNCQLLTTTIAPIINPCLPNPCNNGGNCLQNTPASFICTCPQCYSGNGCQRFNNPCSPCPCANGGICVPQLTASQCSFQCVCSPGFFGPTCLTPTTTAMTTTIDPCSPNPCANGGICCRTGSYGYTCQCPSCFSGPCCQVYNDPCLNSPCPALATCVRQISQFQCSYKCVCPDNTIPPYCVPSTTTTTTPTTIRDPCLPNPCMNGGICCRTGLYGYNCQCSSCYNGPNCQIYNDPCANNPCPSMATCIKIISPFQCTYKCICPENTVPPFCVPTTTSTTTTTTPRDPCLPNPCSNGGVCSRTGLYSYVCICPSCYTGPCCQIYNDPCSNSPCPMLATCIRDITPYKCAFSCQCPPNTIPPYCIPTTTTTTTTTSTTPYDPCRINPCVNGGTCCRNGLLSYICQCRPCYSGQYCQAYNNPCALNPCLNGGTCIPLVNEYQCGFQCLCPSGCYGRNCESFPTTRYNPCLPNPCYNGGTCFPNGYSYQCQCPTTCYGQTCQYYSNNNLIGPTSPCQPNPCYNGASCQTVPYGYNDLKYICICSSYYTGSLCSRFQLASLSCADRDVQFCYWIKSRGYCNDTYRPYCPYSCGTCKKRK